MGRNTQEASRLRRRKGFVLIAAGFALTALAGMVGLAIDLGRFYITKNELQTYTDAAALAAALEINGKDSGITAAKTRAVALPNRWNFSSTALDSSQVTVLFAASPTSGTWVATPDSAQVTTFTSVKVAAAVPLRLYLVPAVNVNNQTNVNADSIAGRLISTSVGPGNLLPFTPIAPTPGDTTNFGFVQGQSYTLRWASNVGNSGAPPAGSMCAADLALGWATGSTLDRVRNGPSSDRGYWGTNSGNQLDDWIENGYDTTLAVGDTIQMANGTKNGRKQAMEDRVNSDADHTSTSFDTYENNRSSNLRLGNGRRVIVVPINAGVGGGTRTVIGFAAFFMSDLSYDDTHGNEPFCGEYIGSYVAGSNSHSGGGAATISKVRLVR